MNTLFVTYALDDAVESYSKISSKLKRYTDWVKLFNRAWIIKTNKSSRKVRDELSEVIENKGKIVVINITDSAWATYRIDNDLLCWMKENI